MFIHQLIWCFIIIIALDIPLILLMECLCFSDRSRNDRQIWLAVLIGFIMRIDQIQRGKPVDYRFQLI